MQILLSSICVESGTDLQLALYYLKSYLLQNKIRRDFNPQVKIHVFNEYEKIPQIVEQIESIHPELLAFSCYIWNIENILKVCSKIKKVLPELKIVLGGPEVSPRAQEILEKHKFIDVVVRGEGEVTFSEVVRNIFYADLDSVKGISFLKNNKVVHNVDREVIANLDEIPSPYLSGIVNLKDKSIVDVPIETTRGCAFSCYYCYYHKSFPGVRYFPLARVEKELKLILSHKPREVYLMDATFNSNPQRAKKILKLFIKHNKNSSLHVELKAELVDEEMAKLLRQANAFNIEIGIQSTNPKTLKAINRSFNKEKFKLGIELLNKSGLFYEIQLIDCLPYQSYQDFKDSLDWLYSLYPIKVVVFRFALLFGTCLRDKAKDYGICFDNSAPYYALKSSVMSHKDIVKIDKLRFAMERLYDSQIFQETLYALRDKAGIKISQVLESWVEWEGQFKRRAANYPDFLNRKSPEFLKFIVKKYKKERVCCELLSKLEVKLKEFVRKYNN